MDETLQKEIERALARGEFRVYLQGQVDIQNGFVICGAEALVRWQHPTRGLLYPAEFLPKMAESGSMPELDLYVLQEVCRFMRMRRKAGLELFRISVNISVDTILHPTFVEKFTAVKEEHHVPDNFLELECPETAVVEHFHEVDVFAKQMRKVGFLLCLDNFGANYSSVKVLCSADSDTIKIDRSLLVKEVGDERIRVVVASVIAMANQLHTKTVAVGVEDMEQVKLLHASGCEVVQGFVFCKPTPMESFAGAIPLDTMLEAQHLCAGAQGDAFVKVAEHKQNVFSPDNNSLCGVMRCQFDAGCTILYANKAMYRVLGYTPQELREKKKNKFYELISAETLTAFDEAGTRLENGQPVEIELRVNRGDGTQAWLHTQMRLTDDDVLEMYTLDATRQIELRHHLLKAEVQMRSMLDRISNGLILAVVEADNIRPVYVNPAMVRMGGWDSAEQYLEARAKVLKTLPPEQGKELDRICRECIETFDLTEIKKMQVTGQTRDGRPLSLLLRAGKFDQRTKKDEPMILVEVIELLGNDKVITEK